LIVNKISYVNADKINGFALKTQDARRRQRRESLARMRPCRSARLLPRLICSESVYCRTSGKLSGGRGKYPLKISGARADKRRRLLLIFLSYFKIKIR
jgi:hypothetical protein